MKDFVKKLKQPNIMVPFFTTIVVGLIAHFPVMTGNLPNADAMSNFYFDQNMVTSGRWFLTVLCGISSYFDLKWVIGVLSLLYLAAGSVILTKFFEVKHPFVTGVMAALVAVFPSVCATYAYMYTADGYFMALAFSFLAAYLTKKYRKLGWLAGAVFLCLSMGTYQAYLSCTILLCFFDLMLLCAEGEKLKEILLRGVRYLGMGALGGALYFVILKICLAAQGKVLDTYQGISSMGKISPSSLPGRIVEIYHDFFGFLRSGRIFLVNGFSYGAVVLLFGMALLGILLIMIHKKSFKKWYTSLLIVVFASLIPLGTNIILLISADAFYHLLMRMQWGLFPVFAVVCVSRGFGDEEKKAYGIAYFAGIAGALLFIWQFILSDNIAYFNMQERYEKTYGYCLRLADRIEQTEGYYTGMPVMMIGVLDEEKYPVTDITSDVTERIFGATGDMLIYKGEQYQAFMAHYLNFTLNVITDEKTIVDIYNSEEYRSMDSFPAADSVKVVDGILYVKTEPPEKVQ